MFCFVCAVWVKTTPYRDRASAWAQFSSTWNALTALPCWEDATIEPPHQQEPPSAAAQRAANAVAALPAGPHRDQAAQLLEQLQSAAARASAPFEWVDGVLVVAMRTGAVLLIDELNLAEDAVLERLNRCVGVSHHMVFLFHTTWCC